MRIYSPHITFLQVLQSSSDCSSPFTLNTLTTVELPYPVVLTLPAVDHFFDFISFFLMYSTQVRIVSDPYRAGLWATCSGSSGGDSPSFTLHFVPSPSSSSTSSVPASLVSTGCKSSTDAIVQAVTDLMSQTPTLDSGITLVCLLSLYRSFSNHLTASFQIAKRRRQLVIFFVLSVIDLLLILC